MTTATITREQTLGPLSDQQRSLIMQHARPMAISARRTFRRLLILAQEHGLYAETIARAAAQARAHFE